MTPLGPPGTRLIFLSVPIAVIVKLPFEDMFEVNKLPTFASPVTARFAPTRKLFAVILPFATMLPEVERMLPTESNSVPVIVTMFALLAELNSRFAFWNILMLLVPFAML